MSKDQIKIKKSREELVSEIFSLLSHNEFLNEDAVKAAEKGFFIHANENFRLIELNNSKINQLEEFIQVIETGESENYISSPSMKIC